MSRKQEDQGHAASGRIQTPGDLQGVGAQAVQGQYSLS